MKHILKKIPKILAVCGTAIALLFASCSDIDTEEELAFAPAGGDYVTLRVAVDNSVRTAYPEISSLEAFKIFALYCDGKAIGKWEYSDESAIPAYQLMSNDPVTVKTGEHEFTLTGTLGSSENSAKYAGTKTLDVKKDGVLSFTLTFAGVEATSTTTGKVNISLKFPKTGTQKITVNRYDYASMTDRTKPTEVADYTTEYSSNLAGDWELSYSSYSSLLQPKTGKYLYEVVFYGSDGLILLKWPELVYVSAADSSLVTNVSIKISDFDDILTITYKNDDGATYLGTQPLKFTGASEITLPTLEKTGYIFNGWFTQADEDGNGTGSDDEKITGWGEDEQSESITLYAKWTPQVFDVDFYVMYDDATEVDSQKVEYGSFAAKPADPTLEGYSFLSWQYFDAESAGMKTFDFEKMPITEDTTLYALWNFPITFKAGAEDATGSVDTIYANQYDTYHLPECGFVREGYTFLYWKTESGGEYAANKSGKFEKPLEFTAVWQENVSGKHIVHFDGFAKTVTVDDGETVEDPGFVGMDYIDDGSAYIYTITGWYTSPDCDEETKFVFGTELVTKDMTLYPKCVQTGYGVYEGGSDSKGDGTLDKTYATVTKALQTISENGSAEYDYTIIVEGRIEECITIPSTFTNAKSLTIHGFGEDWSVLDGNEKGTVLTVETAVPVVIDNILITGGKATENNTGGGLTVAGDSANVTLESGTIIAKNISANDIAGGVYVTSGTFIMEDGAEIRENTIESDSALGAGVYNAGGTFTMNGGKIYNNAASAAKYSAQGGGVYNTGTFTMKDGEISGNKVTSTPSEYHYYVYGGGVYNSGTFTMNGGAIRDNESSCTTAGYGGGVYNYSSNAQFTMNGGAISDNTASSRGGGVYGDEKSQAVMNGGTISGNTASNGGGVYIYGGASFTLIDGKINDNTATSSGGGVSAYYTNATFTMKGGEVSNNTAVGGGGGIRLEYAKLNMTGGKISGNISDSSGGGVYVYSYVYSYGASTFTMSGGEISNNEAAIAGGGAYLCCNESKYAITFTMTGGTIRDNVAKEKTFGDAVYVERYVSFNMGGSAYIPFDASRNHSVYLGNYNNYITVNSSLTATETPVAYVHYGSSYTIKVASELTVADEVVKFGCDNPEYYVAAGAYNGYFATRESGTYFLITYKNEGDTNFVGQHELGYPVYHTPGTVEEPSTTTLDSPSRLHYTFAGWFTDADCTEGNKITELTDSNCTAAITLYAKWTPVTSYDITYKDEGGEDFSGENASSLPAKHYVDAGTILVEAKKEAFIFKGWCTDASCENFVTMLKSDECTAPITLYAKWERAYYPISYNNIYKDDYNNGLANQSFSNTEMFPVKRSVGDTLNLPELAREHSEFIGWYTDKNCTEASLVTELNDENCTAETALYALWDDSFYGTITYMDEGNVAFSGTNASSLPQTFCSDEEVVLVAAQKDGYVFTGWYTNTVAKPEYLVSSLTGKTANVTLYAGWKFIQETVSLAENLTVAAVSGADTITLTASEGFTDFIWKVTPREYEVQKFITGAEVNGNVVTIPKENMLSGFAYEFRVSAKKNGLTYTATVTVTK